MKVEIPFLPMFEKLMLNGRKTMTTRSKKYGEVGDVFEIFGREFVITMVFKQSLYIVSTAYFMLEGFDSKEDFIELWKELHPRVGYQVERKYWVHVFAKKKGSEA